MPRCGHKDKGYGREKRKLGCVPICNQLCHASLSWSSHKKFGHSHRRPQDRSHHPVENASCYAASYRVYLAAACTPNYARPAPTAPVSTIIIAISVHAVAPVPTRIRKNRVFSF
eukprot:COSAG02_NODE_13_length_57813_cov_14.298276_47_plen_114_part_00